MTSAKCWDFLPPCPQIHATFLTTSAFGGPPSPTRCGRHISMAPLMTEQPFSVHWRMTASSVGFIQSHALANHRAVRWHHHKSQAQHFLPPAEHAINAQREEMMIRCLSVPYAQMRSLLGASGTALLFHFKLRFLISHRRPFKNKRIGLGPYTLDSRTVPSLLMFENLKYLLRDSINHVV